MGNKVRIDMGNSFGFVFRAFWWNVCQKDCLYLPEVAFRKTGSEGPNQHGKTVSFVWFEPEDRLQVESPI
jgi:hypothetical protein